MKFKLMVAALFGCLLATAQAEENTAKRIVKQPPSVPQPAATPKTLEQMPVVPPQVTYQGGQLSILARNSTLGEILKAVHAQTGAEIEMPGTGNERVVGSFGPGPARDVLAALLYGSHFNYVLLGSETDPQALSRVMLFAKTATSETAPAETASAAAYQGNNVAPAYQNMARPLPGRPGTPAPNAANQQAADTGEEADAQAEDDSSDADDQADEQADDQSETTTVEGEEPGQVKTPQQMLQELQQQQQQQQNQPGTQPGFPPGIRPGFPPGMQPGMPGGYPPGVTPPGGQQQQQ
jgi:hypothetical protein